MPNNWSYQGSLTNYNKKSMGVITLPTFEEVEARFETAAKMLCSRVLAEPYNFHLIDSKMSAPMGATASNVGAIFLEAQRQFRASRQYSPHSVAMALKLDKSELMSLALEDSAIELLPAFDLFREQYGRKVEADISKEVEGLLYHGKTSEEIAVIQQQRRRDAGLLSTPAASDGKDEFETELVLALEGKVVEYPIKPVIKNMRKMIPHHEPGEYIIIGARTGMGKTYLGLNYIHQASLSGIPTAYINLENTPKNVQKRIWQMHSGIKFKHDLSKLSDAEMKKAVDDWEAVKKMPFKSHHTGRSLQTILNTIRQEYYERGIQLAVIDYIQLMREISFKGNKAGEIGEISAEVRALCLDLKIPLIALAQINRETETKSDKRPGLADLKGSGDLEQDAATVLFPFRPCYYDGLVDEHGMPYSEDYAEIHIAKGRDVGIGLVECRFDPIRGFYDKSDDPFSTQFPATTPAPFTVPTARGLKDMDIPF